MSIKTLLVVVVISTTAGGLSTQLYGQRSTIRLNQGFRYLGGGVSAGYHWRTKGPNVNYYNPWSCHNANTQTGIVPQGAETWMGCQGNCGGGYFPNERPATYEDFGVYLNQSAPSVPGATNVIDAEIDADADQLPENAAESILRDRKIREPTPIDDVDNQNDDETTLLLSPGFFESKSAQARPLQNSNRGQAAYRRAPYRQPK